MYHNPELQETMALYDYQQQFESEPKKLSFHELFAKLVEYRRDTVNLSVSRVIAATEKHSAVNRSAIVENSLRSSFDINKVIPVVDVQGKFAGFDNHDMIAGSGVVEVNEIIAPTTPGAFYDPRENGYAVDTPQSDADARASAARARLESLTNEQFTIAA